MRREPEVRRLVRGDGTIVADHVVVAHSAWARFLGLMFRRELPEGRGLALRPCSSIHMFFMRIPLDVAFVDDAGAVLRIYAGIRPWRVTRFVRRAKAAIELPAGTLARAGVSVGDVLRLADTTAGVS